MIVASEFPTHILVIDDKKNVREALAERVALSSDRHLVRTARDGEEALAHLASEEFDVVLCDLVLKGSMTGLEVIAEIRRHHPQVRTVVFTGKEGRELEHSKSDVLQAGAFLFLSKPIHYDALVHTIDTINSIRRTEYLERCFRTLSEIAYRLQETFDYGTLARSAVAGCRDLGFDRARLYGFDSERETLTGQAASGMPPGFRIEDFAIPFAASPVIAGIFEHDRPQIWNKAALTTRFGADVTEPWITELELHDIPWIDCPLMVGNERIGTLSVDNRRRPDRRYTREDLEIMGVYSGLVAQALNNAELYKQEALADASLRRVLIDAPDAVITTDLHGVINFASPSTERVTGYPPEQVIGRQAAELYTDETGSGDAGRRIAKEIMEQLWKSDTVADRAVVACGPAGQRRRVSLSASLLHDDEGNGIGTLGFLKDLEALEAESRQYRDLVEGIGYGILLLDQHGEVVFGNHKAASLLGKAPDALCGTPLSEMVPASQRQEIEREVQSALVRGEERSLELVLAAADGAPVQVKGHLTPLRPAGSVTGVAVAIYGQEEYFTLLQWGRLIDLGRMVAAVAHEINNPLNNLLPTARDLAEVLRRRGQLDPRIEDYLGIIERNGKRIESIVQHLRDFGRPKKLDKAVLSIGEVLSDSLEFFETRLRNHNVALEVEVEDGLPPVFGDATRLWQVFVNVIGNAAEAMEEQGEDRAIRISARSTPTKVVVEVADSGPGIREDLLPSLFEPFVTTKGAGLGSGLGLALSRNIIEEMHEGQIQAANRADGRGARFTIRLPRHDRQTQGDPDHRQGDRP